MSCSIGESKEKRLIDLTTDELLDCPRIEDGEQATKVLLRLGALAEIRRRLRRVTIRSS